MSGRAADGPVAGARKEGTPYAIGELAAEGPATRTVVVRSLGFLSRLEQRFGESDELGVLRYPPMRGPGIWRIGSSALALAALLRCRHLVEKRYDGLIGRLTRMLLGQQRSDGSFEHTVNTGSGTPDVGRGRIYVDGQSVLGLTLH